MSSVIFFKDLRNTDVGSGAAIFLHTLYTGIGATADSCIVFLLQISL